MTARSLFALGLLVAAVSAFAATAVTEPCQPEDVIPSDYQPAAGSFDLEAIPLWTPLPYTVVRIDRCREGEVELFIHVPYAAERVEPGSYQPGLWESMVATGMQAVVDHYYEFGQPDQMWVYQLPTPTYRPGWVYIGSQVGYSPEGCSAVVHTWPGNIRDRCTSNEVWVVLARKSIPPAVASRMQP